MSFSSAKLKINMMLANNVFTQKLRNLKASDLNSISSVGCSKIENCLIKLNLITNFWYVVNLTLSKHMKIYEHSLDLFIHFNQTCPRLADSIFKYNMGYFKSLTVVGGNKAKFGILLGWLILLVTVQCFCVFNIYSEIKQTDN